MKTQIVIVYSKLWYSRVSSGTIALVGHMSPSLGTNILCLHLHGPVFQRNILSPSWGLTVSKKHTASVFRDQCSKAYCFHLQGPMFQRNILSPSLGSNHLGEHTASFLRPERFGGTHWLHLKVPTFYRNILPPSSGTSVPKHTSSIFRRQCFRGTYCIHP
jgi:hypothetical protein